MERRDARLWAANRLRWETAAKGLSPASTAQRPPAPIPTGLQRQDSPRTVWRHEVPLRKVLLSMLSVIRGTAANSFAHLQHGYMWLVWAKSPNFKQLEPTEAFSIRYGSRFLVQKWPWSVTHPKRGCTQGLGTSTPLPGFGHCRAGSCSLSQLMLHKNISHISKQNNFNESEKYATSRFPFHTITPIKNNPGVCSFLLLGQCPILLLNSLYFCFIVSMLRTFI